MNTPRLSLKTLFPAVLLLSALVPRLAAQGTPPADLDVAMMHRRLAVQDALIIRLRGQVASLQAKLAAQKKSAQNAAGAKTPTLSVRAGLGPPPYDCVLAGRYPAAVGAAEDRIVLRPSDAESLALQAYAMVKLGQARRAGALVTRALALTQPQPGSRARAFALVAQGALADAGGKTGDAASAFKAAGAVDETLALPSLALADHFVKLGQADTARALLQAALRKRITAPERTALQQALGRL